MVVVLSLAISSCAAQNQITEAGSTSGGGQSFRWRVEIKVQPHNNDFYGVLAVFGNAPQPISLKPANDMLQGAAPGIIVVYTTATNSQVQQLRESLFEAGAIGVNVNKVNQ